MKNIAYACLLAIMVTLLVVTALDPFLRFCRKQKLMKIGSLSVCRTHFFQKPVYLLACDLNVGDVSSQTCSGWYCSRLRVETGGTVLIHVRGEYTFFFSEYSRGIPNKDRD